MIVRRLGLLLFTLAAASCTKTSHLGSTPASDAAASDAAASDAAAPAATWRSAGHDDDNTRSQPLEHKLDPSNVSRLGIKWFFRTEGDPWATPAVDETAIYVPDSLGNLFAVERESGNLLWKRRIEDITGVAKVVARATPTI